MTLRAWIRGITIGLVVFFAAFFVLIAATNAIGGDTFDILVLLGLVGMLYLEPIVSFVLAVLLFAELRRRIREKERWGATLAYSCLSAAFFVASATVTHLMLEGRLIL